MEKKLEAGQTVYNEHGECAEYVAVAGEGHVVRPLIETTNWEGETSDYIGNPIVWRTAFAEPPVPKVNAELKALHDQIDAANDRLRAVREEERIAAASARERLDRLAKLDQLRYIEDFLDGKLTHYAVLPEYDGIPKVLPVAEAFSEESRYEKRQRLFCLYGDRKQRTLHWHLHRYSDSSGSMAEGLYFPARSEDEAKEIIRRELARRIKEVAGGAHGYEANLVAGAQAWGVEVPDAMAQKVADITVAVRQRNIEEATRALQQAQARLAQLGASAA